MKILIKYNIPIAICFLMLVWQNTFAYTQIKKFDNEWLVYDKYYQAYIPLINLKNSLKSASLSIDIQDFPNSYLTFTSKKGLYLFVDNQVVYSHIDVNEALIRLNLDSLNEKFSKKKMLITFYNFSGQLPLFSTSIEKQIKLTNQSQSITNMLPILIKYKQLKYSFAFWLIFMGLVFVLLKQLYTKELYLIFMLFESKDSQDITPSPLTFVMLMMTMTLAIMFTLVFEIYHLAENSNGVLQGMGSISYFFIILVLLFLKYLYLSLFSWMFNFNKFKIKHFFIHFKTMYLAYFLCFIIFVIDYFSGIQAIELSYFNYLSLIGIVIAVATIRVLYYYLSNVTFRNLYLFSYLCVAEILPLVVGVKLMLF